MPKTNAPLALSRKLATAVMRQAKPNPAGYTGGVYGQRALIVQAIDTAIRPLVDALEAMPELDCEPKTPFGHAYREWQVTARAALKEAKGENNNDS